MATFTVGDTLPALSGTCSSDAGVVNGSVATATTAHIQRPDGTVLSRTVTATNLGAWTMLWQVGDLTQQGVYQVEVEVTFSPGNVQTFGPQSFYVGPQIA